jgi:ADP-heptose:LPS heptosyltransferase
VAGPGFIGFQLKNIGDALMCLPALGLIKEGIPGARTALVVRPPAAPLFIGNPLVDQVFVTGHDSRSLRVGSTLSLSRRLSREKFQAALGFDHKRRSGILSLLSGQKRRYASSIPGYEEPRWPWRASGDGKWRGPRPPMETHMAVSQAALAATALGLEFSYEIKRGWWPALPPIPGEAREAADKLLEGIQRHPGAPLVGLCLTGRQPEKTWPLRYFAEVVQELSERRGARFIITGGDSDKRAAEALKGLVKAPMDNFCGRTGLLEFAALLSRLDLFITVDTGSAHLAGLAGVPLIVIYTASNPLQWAPFNEQGTRLFCYDLVLRRYGLPAPEGALVSRPYVSPGDVLEAAGELLP